MPWGYLTPDDTIENFVESDSSVLEDKFTSGVKEHIFCNSTCHFPTMTMTVGDCMTLKLVRFGIQDMELIWLRETELLERHEPLSFDIMSLLSHALKNKYIHIQHHVNNTHTITFDLLNMLMLDKKSKFNIMASPFIQEEPNHNSNETVSNIPKEYICPISSDVMKDPVVASDGFTYERRYIQEWITCNKARSPMTNQPLSRLLLFSNSTLKSLISNATL